MSTQTMTNACSSARNVAGCAATDAPNRRQDARRARVHPASSRATSDVGWCVTRHMLSRRQPDVDARTPAAVPGSGSGRSGRRQGTNEDTAKEGAGGNGAATGCQDAAPRSGRSTSGLLSSMVTTAPWALAVGNGTGQVTHEACPVRRPQGRDDVALERFEAIRVRPVGIRDPGPIRAGSTIPPFRFVDLPLEGELLPVG